DKLENGVVEHALVGSERLDVPAHELTEDALDETLDPAARFPLRSDGPKALGERPRRCELGGRRCPCARATAKLLAEPFEEGCDIDLLRRGNACRRRVFRLAPGHSAD